MAEGGGGSRRGKKGEWTGVTHIICNLSRKINKEKHTYQKLLIFIGSSKNKQTSDCVFCQQFLGVVPYISLPLLTFPQGSALHAPEKANTEMISVKAT